MDNFPDIVNEYGLSGPVVVGRTCKMEQGTGRCSTAIRAGSGVAGSVTPCRRPKQTRALARSSEARGSRASPWSYVLPCTCICTPRAWRRAMAHGYGRSCVTRFVCPLPNAAGKPTIADGVGGVPVCGTTALRGGVAPFFRCVAATIKTGACKCGLFAIVGRFFGSKNTGLYFHSLLPARLEGIYSAGGKT
jgi:hypothetical protein